MEQPVESIVATLLGLLAERRADASICPSDVARALRPDEAAWRALMPSVREIAARLARDGRVLVSQRGHAVDIHQAVGPVRLRRGPLFGMVG